jgi:hypothetical protein
MRTTGRLPVFLGTSLLCLMAGMQGLVLVSAEEERSEPALAFSPSEVDLGRIPQQTIGRATVILRNISRTSVEIRGATSDCACTVLDVHLIELNPQQSTLLTLGFESRDYQGSVERNILVTTNRGTQEIKLRAYVAPAMNLDIQPLPLKFNATTADGLLRRTISIRPRSGNNAEIVLATIDHSELQVRLIDGAAVGEKNVELYGSRPLAPGIYKAVVTIARSDRTDPDIKLPLSLVVRTANGGKYGNCRTSADHRSRHSYFEWTPDSGITRNFDESAPT